MTSTQSSEGVKDVYLNQAKDILSGSLLIPAETINADDDLRSLGDIDSLTFELIVLEIEKNTGRAVDPIALLELTSVRDVGNLLEKSKK